MRIQFSNISPFLVLFPSRNGPTTPRTATFDVTPLNQRVHIPNNINHNNSYVTHITHIRIAHKEYIYMTKTKNIFKDILIDGNMVVCAGPILEISAPNAIFWLHFIYSYHFFLTTFLNSFPHTLLIYNLDFEWFLNYTFHVVL